MANTIILKKSSVAGKVPLSGDLTFGEVALNYADGKIYYKNTTTNIDFVGNGGTFTNRLSITDTTQSTSTTTGALTVTGGVGIGGNLNVGGTLSTFNSPVSIGTSVSDAELTISASNQDVISALSASGTNVHIIGTNGLISRITQDSFGTNTYVAFTGRAARGTAANPTASQAGDLLAQFTARGYATASTGFGNNSTGKIDIWAEENHTDIARGTYITFATTPNGTINPVERLRIDHLGVVKISHLGATSSINLNNAMLVATSDVDSYAQVQIQNKSNGTSASSDYIATANDGDDTSSYIDLGINNSGYSSVDWTMSGPRDGYLYVAGNNLTLGTDEPGKEVRVHVGGTLAADVVAIFRDPGTASTSDITGSFNVNGGMGLTGDLHIGETLHIGADPLTALSNTLMIGTANIDGFTQVSIQNRNAGPNASADYVVTADDGNDTTGYINLGLNNSGYSDPDWTISGPRDGYLYVAGNNLTLGTDSTGTTVKIHVGGTTATDIVATFNEPNTNSSSTSSGALVVVGGAGISLDLRVGGTVYSNGTALANFNTSTLVLQAVSATTATNAATAYSTIGTLTAGTGLSGSSFNGSSNQTWTLNTATLMTNAVTSINIAGGAAGSIPIQSAAGTTAFIPIGSPNFVLQSDGTTATWVSTSSLGISGGGSSGVSSITAGTDTAVSTSTGAVTVWNTSTLQSITSRGATTNQAVSITNTTSSTSTTTGALQVVGGVGIGGNLHVGGNIVVRDTAIVGNASTTSVLTSAVTIDSFPSAIYRSAQYIVSISNAGLGEYQTSDVLVVHNGTNSFVQATSVFTGNKAILNYSTTISGGNVLLQGTGNQTGANANIVKIQKTYITI